MITTLLYRDNKFVAQNPPTETLAAARAEASTMLWVDLSNPTEEEIKLIFGELFAFHPLVIEDCVSDSPLPKLEEYEDYLYVVMHAVESVTTGEFSTTELDLILGRNFLVTFHRKPLKPIQAALDRSLRPPLQPIRGPDRIAHTILDSLVDGYKPVLENLRHELEHVESAVLAHAAADELFPRVVALRKRLSQLRQIVRPQFDVTNGLAQGKTKLIRSVIVPYLRDLAEDLGRIETQAGSYAEQLILTFRVYLNKSSHEANEGIRVLTGLTALTIPPLVIGGWFGMNFSRMHELAGRFAYPVAALAMIGSITGIFFMMRKKRWL